MYIGARAICTRLKLWQIKVVSSYPTGQVKEEHRVGAAVGLLSDALSQKQQVCRVLSTGYQQHVWEDTYLENEPLCKSKPCISLHSLALAGIIRA